ncbi:MAG TPA: proton-conducting transporter membrane subunit [Steroidobacteraceae bacterium]|nr:proton-conducting transporter membrane subunit [Steroidobacteraceae bacterium]
MSLGAGLLVSFFALCALGGLGAFGVPRGLLPRWIAGVGSVCALTALTLAAIVLVGGETFHITLWPVLSLGRPSLSADRLSGLFLFVTGLVYLPVSLFSSHYLLKHAEHRNLRYFSLLYHSLFAAIALVLVADDAISFLVGWEAMSIISYLLVTFEDREESAQAGYVMLAMSEAGSVAVIIAFVLAAGSQETLDFAALRTGAAMLGPSLKWAIFLLSFFGFAVKAGLVPRNSWLPLAHPAAPTNVSALLSAVIVNLGIYGIARFALDLAPVRSPNAGLIVLLVGSVSALVGILYATIQSELKRLLAHSTIENMGIVAAGLGACLVFVSTGHEVAASIALVAALYHLTNHSIYKALLFVGTGLIEERTGTRDLDRLGGLIRHLPWTSGLFLIGVLSIAALPPLNGFVSEWLTLQTILRSEELASTPDRVLFAVSGALLALTAGLAVTCFAKVFSMGFLGIARSNGAARATEAPRSTRWPLGILAAACIALGVLPTYVIPVIDGASSPFVHASATIALVPPFFDRESQQREHVPETFLAEFHGLGSEVGHDIVPGRGLVVLHRGEERNPVVFAMSTSYTAIVLGLIVGASFVLFRALTWRRRLTRSAAWDGGIRRLWPGITYTATGFSNPVRVVFRALLRPTTVEDSTEAVATHFRTAIRREDADVPITDRLILGPPVRALQQAAALVRRMHVGHVNAYAGYVLFALLFALIVGVVALFH